MEAKSFLSDVFEYDYHNEVHREVATKILDIIDVNNNGKYELQRFKQFFTLPNFIEIAELETVHSLDAQLRANAARVPEYEAHWPVQPIEREGFFDGWVQVVLIILNLSITCFFIINDQFKEVKNIRGGFWKMLSLPFTGIYFVECCYVIFTTAGETIVREKKLYLLEIICQVVSILAYIRMFSESADADYASGASLLSFAFLIRNLRLTTLLEERREFKVIMQMIMKMTMPFMYQLACLYIVYYVFAIIAMEGLGGLIVQPKFHSENGIPNNLYYLVNFNDLASSIMTLYTFMIINNWPAITDTMVNASGMVWPRIYFMVFYILVQWIILNIVIAMMLDIFTNVEGEMDSEFDRLSNIKALMAKEKELGNDRFDRFCDGVNEDLMKEVVDKDELDKRCKAQKLDKAKKLTSD